MLLKEGLPIDDYAVFYRHHGNKDFIPGAGAAPPVKVDLIRVPHVYDADICGLADIQSTGLVQNSQSLCRL